MKKSTSLCKGKKAKQNKIKKIQLRNKNFRCQDLQPECILNPIQDVMVQKKKPQPVFSL